MEREKIVMLVAENIEAAMKRKGTNPAEVARRAGINPTGVYDILSGKSRSPRLDTLYKIAVDGLGIPFSSLFADPSDTELDREIIEAVGMMPAEERQRLLLLAKALLSSPASA